MIERELPAERDSFLSSKSLHAIIDEEKYYLDHALVVGLQQFSIGCRGKGRQQVTKGLLFGLSSDEEGVKDVQTKLHVNIGFVIESVRKLLETAYKCGKKAPPIAATDTGDSKS